MTYLAYPAIWAAIGFTIYANGAYAYAHAGADLHHRLAFVALAVIVDIWKATALLAASRALAQWRILPWLIILPTWLAAFVVSTTMGYSYLITTRDEARLGNRAAAEARVLAQDAYDRAKADLATVQTSPDWKATAACTRPRNSRQRAFCAAVESDQAKLAAAAAQLKASPPVSVAPEVTGLAAATGWTTDRITFLIAFVPAVLVELLAALGLYLVRQRMNSKPSTSLQDGQTAPPPPWAAPSPAKPLTAAPVALASGPVPKPQVLTWKVAAKPPAQTDA